MLEPKPQLSRRDEFAKAVLQGICASNLQIFDSEEERKLPNGETIKIPHYVDRTEWGKSYAHLFVLYADALIAELDKTPNA